MAIGQRLMGDDSFEEALNRRHQHAIDERLLAAPVKKEGAALGVVFAKRLEPREVFGGGFRGVFHFYRHELAGGINDEIDLQPGPRAPIV